MSMKSLIEKRNQFKAEVDSCTNQMDALVKRVTNLFHRHKFSGWEGYYYDHQGPHNEILGNHLIPQYFKYFEVEEDSLRASGMYSGSKGYYEQESISFPLEWLDKDDTELVEVFNQAWQTILSDRKAADEKRKVDALEAERQQFEKLKEKFG